MVTAPKDGYHRLTGALPMAGRMAVAALVIMSMAGCVTSPASRSTVRSGDARLVNGAQAEYVIGAGDVLEVLVWRNEALSRIVTVRPDGKISLPLINDVQAAGLTPMLLKELIAAELKKFKELPEVSVIVNETKSQVVYLMGQIIRPGPYPLGPNATALQVIAQAGGFTPFADRNNIVIIRRSKDTHKEQRIEVSYKSILAGRSAKGDVALQAGDTIIVP